MMMCHLAFYPLKFYDYYNQQSLISRKMINSPPVSFNRLSGQYPLSQIPPKIRLPLNNVLLVSTKSAKKRSKKIESSRATVVPIHQLQVKQSHDDDGEGYIRKYGRLRVSLFNERKKKMLQLSNSSFCSLYEKDIKKSQSEVLKKNFEKAFKGMIGKKKLFSKQKQLKAAHELWSSLKLRKDREVVSYLTEDPLQGQKNILPLKNSTSDKQLFNKTSNSLYNQAFSVIPHTSKLYLTGHQFKRAKDYVMKLRESGQFKEGSLRSCLHVRHEGEIKPWNHENKRYKTEMGGEGKSGEITEWLRGKKIC